MGSKEFLSPIDQSSIKRKSFVDDQTISDHDEMLIQMDPGIAQRFKDAKDIIEQQKLMNNGQGASNKSERDISKAQKLLPNLRSNSTSKNRFFHSDSNPNLSGLSKNVMLLKHNLQEAESSLHEQDSI